MHTSGTVTCIGVSSYLLHSPNMRQPPRPRTSNSVLRKQSAKLGTMESTFCDVGPARKQNAPSFRQRQCRYCMNAQQSDEPNSVARQNHPSTMRCKCGDASGANASCWIVFDDCPVHLEGAQRIQKRRRGKSCASLSQCGWPWHCGRLSSRRRSNQAVPPIARFLVFRTLVCRRSAHAPRSPNLPSSAVAAIMWHHKHVRASFRTKLN